MEIVKKARKAVFKKFFMRRANANYIATSAQKMVMPPMKTNFLLITLAFNDLELIKLQKISLKKIADSYDHIVADNSSDNEQAKAIEAFCAEQNIGYVRLPQPNPGSKFDRSLSHGFSLNWIFYNVVKKMQPEKFGFLESDVLIGTPESLLAPWEGKLFWGLLGPSQSPNLSEGDKKRLWRLWPGFCFFSRDLYHDKEFNFLPITYIDTAGGNWVFLKDFDTSHLIQWENVEQTKFSSDDANCTQWFGGVVHLAGMSLRSDSQENVRKLEFARRIASENIYERPF